MNPTPPVKSLVKSEIVAIGYSVAVKQILKLSKTKAEANSRLFREDMGMRIADEYMERDTSSYEPKEVTTALLKGIFKEYLGCECSISNKEVKYQKTKFTISFRVTITENAISDFIIMGGSQGKTENDEDLNYNAIITGFACGCMKSMCYHPTITMVEGALQASTIMALGKTETIFDVEMWKEKEED